MTQSEDTEIPLLYRLARHIRNTDQLAAIPWGVAGMNLLVDVQRADPEQYDRYVRPGRPADAVGAVEAGGLRYNRELLVTVLVYHYRKNISGCGCGWSKLGASHPEHVADVYEEAIGDAAAAGPDDGEIERMTRPELKAALRRALGRAG